MLCLERLACALSLNIILAGRQIVSVRCKICHKIQFYRTVRFVQLCSKWMIYLLYKVLLWIPLADIPTAVFLTPGALHRHKEVMTFTLGFKLTSQCVSCKQCQCWSLFSDTWSHIFLMPIIMSGSGRLLTRGHSLYIHNYSCLFFSWLYPTKCNWKSWDHLKCCNIKLISVWVIKHPVNV